MRWSSGFVLEMVLRQPSHTSLASVLFTKQNHLTYVGPEIGLSGAGIVSFNVEPVHVSIDTMDQPRLNASLHRIRASWDAITGRLALQIDKGPVVEKLDLGVMGVDATGFEAVIGTNFDGFEAAIVDIAEVVVVTSRDDMADPSQLEAYLDAKYAL